MEIVACTIDVIQDFQPFLTGEAGVSSSIATSDVIQDFQPRYSGLSTVS